MRLKKIRLAGFKSFVDPTNIPFPGDMTAVVGPNGCGKSNVIDAVRWVLGESSAKNLRGDAMTDVIFNGSSARKSVSQCSVELVFDNSSGRIAGEYANYAELSVKRIVTKDAISSYMLNGAKCRRRDITDLFLGTGLGPRSYAIIEQGMISKLIESKPQELRIFIEEAAGISKYKERRKETLNRISHTKDNLDRLEDVRQELGEQLSKLKRQATAATRFKELKAEERLLKGQLATMRYLTQSELLKRSDEVIAQYQSELESLISGRQGDESGLQALKNDQSICKQAISDYQQDIYQLGNDITKLEQSQLFAKKRGAQIEAEIQHLIVQSQEAKSALSKIEEELDAQEAQIMTSEPEKEILQEQLEEVEQQHELIQDKQAALSKALKAAEDTYYQQKQLVQQKHSQLHQTLSLQQRTEARISELTNELAELGSANDDAIESLEAQRKALAEQVKVEKAKLTTARDETVRARQALEHHEQDCALHEKALITLEAERQALLKLQVNQSNEGSALVPYLQGKSLTPSWQAFSVKAGYEKALETAIAIMGDVLVAEDVDFSGLLEGLSRTMRAADGLTFDAGDSGIEQSEAKGTIGHHQPSVALSLAFTEQKQEGSLSAFINESAVPVFFNALKMSENLAAAQSLLNENQNALILLKDGGMLMQDAYISPDKSESGFITREAQIKELTRRCESMISQLSSKQSARDSAKQNFKALEAQQRGLEEGLAKLENEHGLLARDLKNAMDVRDSQASRKVRLQDEIEKQSETLAQEQMSFELLSEEIEDGSILLSELEAQKQEAESGTKGFAIELQAISSQQQSLQHRLHEQVLLNQRLQNSYKVLQEQHKGKAAKVKDNEDKVMLLKDEAQSLLLPAEEQREKLSEMLERKEHLADQQREKQNSLENIEDEISTIEKGQVGINTKIDSIKGKIESERLSAQTAKVKAQSFVEQLSEMKLKVQEVLEHLPEDAEEDGYQERLNSVSASVSRLGAVNLAAVEEFEEQMVRKQHLDDQNADLTQALDTLEAAMQKIDKETRTRFKHTFDQINGDLKTLFPKVFGGGSAYLDLTDDDLLDTGVTIMARPPGKKNSTIHLLSGGEKALTALSLVFAIFRLNPAPFCLLDEVDAPLDDANVGRFCKLVSEMSKTVQFIYITHNKVAMEMATHLTGVTMAEPGVSRMVSVDMEEALAIAE
ncbi:chromosome segregation protein SMC [Ningiella sp. W23]|uniref:chromosome segregation protein SMC n=1 Tax=Ningiella sp. W23 TaxID=3023715 RepID=UPI0037575429